MVTELPNDPQAERAFLGSLFARPQFVQKVSGLVLPRDFYKPENQIIYASLLRIAASDELPLDMIGVSTDLKAREQLRAAGGVANITQIAALSMDMPTSLNDFQTCKKYAEIILHRSMQRQAIKAFEEATSLVLRGDDVGNVVQCVNDTLENANRGTTINGIGNSIEEWTAWYEETRLLGDCTGIHTGLFELDGITGGWQNGNLIVLGARPSMGKSALALNFAAAACRDDQSVAIFSLEMTRREIMSRLVAAEGDIDIKHTTIPSLITEEERGKIKKVFETISNWGLFIDDTPNMPLSQIATKARRLKYAGKLDLVIIDHLNLIGTDTKKENRTNEVADITKRLKGLAKELNVPVICLCQLSRGVESRQEKKPQMSDLRESGTIEQDADLVLLLYREGYYTKDPSDNSAELIISKHRGGKTGTVNLIFTGEKQIFVDDVLQGVTTKVRGVDMPL